MHPRTPFDISRLATAVMLACVGLNVSATSSQSVGVVTGRQVTVAGKPVIEYVRTQNRVQVKTLPTHSDLDDDPLSDWRYVWKIDGAVVPEKPEANAGSASTIPVHPILQDQYNKPATLCLKAVTSRGYPEETRTSAETCSDAVQLTNAAPTFTDVSVSGTLQVGNRLSASHTYSDADGDSMSLSGRVQWYRSDDATGRNKAKITGATAPAYTPVDADKDKYLSVEMSPGALTGLSPGLAVESPLVGPVVPEPLINRFSKPEGAKLKWAAANKYCDELVLKGFSDWRLPNIDELVNLYRENGTALTMQFGWQTGWYWSTTEDFPGENFGLYLPGGQVEAMYGEDSHGAYNVTCVR